MSDVREKNVCVFEGVWVGVGWGGGVMSPCQAWELGIKKQIFRKIDHRCYTTSNTFKFCFARVLLLPGRYQPSTIA